jgi:hypothetical protein
VRRGDHETAHKLVSTLSYKAFQTSLIPRGGRHQRGLSHLWGRSVRSAHGHAEILQRLRLLKPSRHRGFSSLLGQKRPLLPFLSKLPRIASMRRSRSSMGATQSHTSHRGPLRSPGDGLRSPPLAQRICRLNPLKLWGLTPLNR